MTGVRAIAHQARIPERPVSVVSRHDDIRVSLRLIAGEGCRLFHGHVKFSPLFDQLEQMGLSTLPAKFIDNDKVSNHISTLFSLLTEHETIAAIPINESRRKRVENKILVSLEALIQIHSRALPPSSSPSASKMHRTKVARILAEKSFTEDAIDDTLAALEFLERNKDWLYRRFVSRLESPKTPGHEIAGAIAELRAILYISRIPSLEIVDANVSIIQRRTGNRIEFFDIIARDSTTGKLILFEIKRNNDYTLGDFIYQFLGIGSNKGGEARKTLSQIDVLLEPEGFQIPETYLHDLISGNYEVRILTHRRLYDFEPLYGRPKQLDNGGGCLLSHLLLPSTHISFAKDTVRILTREDIGQGIQNLREQIRGRTAVGDTSITFDILP